MLHFCLCFSGVNKDWLYHANVDISTPDSSNWTLGVFKEYKVNVTLKNINMENLYMDVFSFGMSSSKVIVYGPLHMCKLKFINQTQGMMAGWFEYPRSSSFETGHVDTISFEITVTKLEHTNNSQIDKIYFGVGVYTTSINLVVIGFDEKNYLDNSYNTLQSSLQIDDSIKQLSFGESLVLSWTMIIQDTISVLQTTIYSDQIHDSVFLVEPKSMFNLEINVNKTDGLKPISIRLRRNTNVHLQNYDTIEDFIDSSENIMQNIGIVENIKSTAELMTFEIIYMTVGNITRNDCLPNDKITIHKYDSYRFEEDNRMFNMDFVVNLQAQIGTNDNIKLLIQILKNKGSVERVMIEDTFSEFPCIKNRSETYFLSNSIDGLYEITLNPSCPLYNDYFSSRFMVKALIKPTSDSTLNFQLSISLDNVVFNYTTNSIRTNSNANCGSKEPVISYISSKSVINQFLAITYHIRFLPCSNIEEYSVVVYSPSNETCFCQAHLNHVGRDLSNFLHNQNIRLELEGDEVCFTRTTLQLNNIFRLPNKVQCGGDNINGQDSIGITFWMHLNRNRTIPDRIIIETSFNNSDEQLQSEFSVINEEVDGNFDVINITTPSTIYKYTPFIQKVYLNSSSTFKFNITITQPIFREENKNLLRFVEIMPLYLGKNHPCILFETETLELEDVLKYSFGDEPRDNIIEIGLVFSLDNPEEAVGSANLQVEIDDVNLESTINLCVSVLEGDLPFMDVKNIYIESYGKNLYFSGELVTKKIKSSISFMQADYICLELKGVMLIDAANISIPNNLDRNTTSLNLLMESRINDISVNTNGSRHSIKLYNNDVEIESIPVEVLRIEEPFNSNIMMNIKIEKQNETFFKGDEIQISGTLRLHPMAINEEKKQSGLMIQEFISYSSNDCFDEIRISEICQVIASSINTNPTLSNVNLEKKWTAQKHEGQIYNEYLIFDFKKDMFLEGLSLFSNISGFFIDVYAGNNYKYMPFVARIKMSKGANEKIKLSPNIIGRYAKLSFSKFEKGLMVNGVKWFGCSKNPKENRSEDCLLLRINLLATHTIQKTDDVNVLPSYVNKLIGYKDGVVYFQTSESSYFASKDGAHIYYINSVDESTLQPSQPILETNNEFSITWKGKLMSYRATLYGIEKNRKMLLGYSPCCK
ncbi:unnamed protein product [Lepeophtheirus salmonis]|uniref:(salmon louse) hypothetical protein n=1 Tax=Lepeophtheirus salmonis TaxID=72036 RepID=A0A7R8H273_LEPSM|nr:unnamed protein product [Lepeophtheirus salmonis]CAF2822562.1 unnamed protein product [Lepeophtheirus salmonis]